MGVYIYQYLEPEVYFDYGDWTTSTWTGSGNIGRYTNRVEFNSTGSSNYVTYHLSEYPIDFSRDFLLEFNGDIPNSNFGPHQIGLVDNDSHSILVGIHESTNYRNLCCWVDGTVTKTNDSLSRKDFFIKKEGDALSIGWDDTVKYTGNYTFADDMYLYAQSYAYYNLLTIYTAKLTYL